MHLGVTVIGNIFGVTHCYPKRLEVDQQSKIRHDGRSRISSCMVLRDYWKLIRIFS